MTYFSSRRNKTYRLDMKHKGKRGTEDNSKDCGLSNWVDKEHYKMSRDFLREESKFLVLNG